MGHIRNLAAVLTLTFSGACAVDGAVGSKAGGDDGPTVLRIGFAEFQGASGAQHVETYVDLVDRWSGGSLLLEPVWDASGRGRTSDAVVDDWDQVVARRVVDGDLDLAVVPARAWDTEGVTTLRALNAPLLVTSEDLVERVVTSDLADDLLAGLDAVGVVGLALLPEHLRHLFVFGDRNLSDLRGGVIRAPRSDTVYAFLEALGASPDDLPITDEELFARVQRGEVVGAEGSFESLVGSVATGFGNVTLFPRLDTLVANGDTFGGLSDEHRSALRAAAEELVAMAVDGHLPDIEAATRFCRDGGTVTDATTADVTAVERAAAAVHEELRREPSTAALLDRLAELAGAPMTLHGVPPCGPPTVDHTVDDVDDDVDQPSTSAVVDSATEFPDGVYRMEMPLEALLDAGVEEMTARNHAGLWTLHFEDGSLLDPTCPGSTYSVADGRVTILLGTSGSGCGSAAGKVLFSATWTLDGDALQFGDVRSGHGNDLLIETLFGTLPFTRIR